MTHWIETIPEKDAGSVTKELQGPHLIDFAGQRYTFSTDGLVAIMLPPMEYPEASDKAKSRLIEKLPNGIGGATVDLPALKEWAGTVEVPGLEPCEQCNGTGIFECPTCCHESECNGCDGSGKQDEDLPDRHGLLFGLGIDRRRLAKVLVHLEGDTCTVNTDDKPIIFRGHDWIVFLMPMDKPNVEKLESFEKVTA